MSSPLRSVRIQRAGALLALGIAFWAAPAAAQAQAIDLGTAGSFVVLGGSAVTNTGPSVLNGDLGVAPGTSLSGFGSPAVVNGATHANDAVAGQAQSDLTTAYNVAAGQAVTSELTGQDLGGQLLPAGAYRYASSAQLTGEVTLDAAGDPAAQFIFMIGSTLTTASNSSVRLINGASPCNVFWQVGSSATLGTTTAFAGNILALTSITLNNAATVQGRVLARNGAVTLDNNVLDRPACSSSSPSSGTPTSTSGGGTTPTGQAGSPGSTGTPGSIGTPGSAGPLTPGTSEETAGAGGAPGVVPTARGTAVLLRRFPRSPSSPNAPNSPNAPSSPNRGCLSGFTATVRGTMIRRVVFTLGGRQIASRTRPAFHAYIAPQNGRRVTIRARVTFKDATRAKTLKFTYKACAAALLSPGPGPSQFAG